MGSYGSVVLTTWLLLSMLVRWGDDRVPTQCFFAGGLLSGASFFGSNTCRAATKSEALSTEGYISIR